MKTPDALFGVKPQPAALSGSSNMPPISRYPANNSVGSVNSSSPSPYSAAYTRPGQSTASTASPYSPGSQGAQSVQSYSSSAAPGSYSLQTASGPYDPSSVLTKLHPAIRAQYAAMLQRTNSHLQAQTQAQAHPQAPSQPPSQPSQPRPRAQPPNHSPTYQAPHFMGQAQVQRSPQWPQQPVSGIPQPHHMSQPMAHQAKAQAQAQTQPQPQSYPHQPQVHAFSFQNTSIKTPGPQKSAVQSLQNSSNTAQSPQTTSTQASQIHQPTPKRTFVPPPRPWEQLQRAGQSSSVPPPAPMVPHGVLGGSVNKGPGPSQPIPEGPQPSNVSGPFWQKLPQKTMPNSNSLSQQPGHNPFQYNNSHQ